MGHGQQWLWKTARRSPLESALVTAIREWVAVHPGLIDLDRVHSGKWSVGRFIPRARCAPGDPSFVPAGFMEGARTGTPDFVGMVLPGRARLRVGMAIYVECKREGEQPTDEQTQRLSSAVLAGAIAILAYDVEQFERELLEAIGLLREPGGRIVPA